MYFREGPVLQTKKDVGYLGCTNWRGELPELTCQDGHRESKTTQELLAQ